MNLSRRFAVHPHDAAYRKACFAALRDPAAWPAMVDALQAVTRSDLSPLLALPAKHHRAVLDAIDAARALGVVSVGAMICELTSGTLQRAAATRKGAKRATASKRATVQRRRELIREHYPRKLRVMRSAKLAIDATRTELHKAGIEAETRTVQADLTALGLVKRRNSASR